MDMASTQLADKWTRLHVWLQTQSRKVGMAHERAELDCTYTYTALLLIYFTCDS